MSFDPERFMDYASRQGAGHGAELGIVYHGQRHVFFQFLYYRSAFLFYCLLQVCYDLQAADTICKWYSYVLYLVPVVCEYLAKSG